MQLSQLRYFAEICENGGNMTRAAQKLHVSQPALSKAIQELEKELSVMLFLRVKQRIELTKEGNYLYYRVRKILDQVDELPVLVRQQIASQLVLGIHPGIAYLIFEFLGEFSSLHPDITVLMNAAYGRRAELVDAVLGEKLDAAILIFNPLKNFPAQKGLQVCTFSHTHLSYMVSKNHPLAEKTEVNYQELARYPLYGHTTQAQKIFKNQGIQPKALINTHDIRLIGSMVHQQNGGAILLDEIADMIPGCVKIPLAEPTKADIALILKKEPTPSKAYMLNCLVNYIDNNKK